MAKIKKRPPSRPEPKSTCDRMTDAWWNICLSCWQWVPGSRPSASGILADIERVGLFLMGQDDVTIARQAMSTNEVHPSACPSRSSTVDLVDNGQTI